MRSSRMRGYGSWCIGWNEASRKQNQPSNNGNGCALFLIGFGILFLISSIKVCFETGSPLALFFGLAVIAGIIKGLNNG